MGYNCLLVILRFQIVFVITITCTRDCNTMKAASLFFIVAVVRTHCAASSLGTWASDGIQQLLSQSTRFTTLFGLPNSRPSPYDPAQIPASSSWLDDGKMMVEKHGTICTYLSCACHESSCRYGLILFPDELITYPEYPQYALRVRYPELCDPDVHQISGYIDVQDSKHSLFFWFFESR